MVLGFEVKVPCTMKTSVISYNKMLKELSSRIGLTQQFNGFLALAQQIMKWWKLELSRYSSTTLSLSWLFPHGQKRAAAIPGISFYSSMPRCLEMEAEGKSLSLLPSLLMSNAFFPRSTSPTDLLLSITVQNLITCYSLGRRWSNMIGYD